MSRAHRMLIAAWPTLLMFALFGIFCLWQNAQWPTQWHIVSPTLTPEQLELVRTGRSQQIVGLEDFLIFVVAVGFISIKATTILRNLDVVDWLAISLVAANIVFGLLYFLFITGVLFPYWFATHPTQAEWIKTSLRYLLVIVLAWGILTLINVPRVDQKPVPRWETPAALCSIGAFIGVVIAITLGADGLGQCWDAIHDLFFDIPRVFSWLESQTTGRL